MRATSGTPPICCKRRQSDRWSWRSLSLWFIFRGFLSLSGLDLGLPLVDPSGGFDVVEPDGLLVVVPEELDDGVLDAVIVLLDVADDP